MIIKKKFHDVDIFLGLTYFTFFNKISLNTHNYTYLTHSGTQTLIGDAEKYHTCHVLSVDHDTVQFWIDVHDGFE